VVVQCMRRYTLYVFVGCLSLNSGFGSVVSVGLVPTARQCQVAPGSQLSSLVKVTGTAGLTVVVPQYYLPDQMCAPERVCVVDRDSKCPQERERAGI
jgi:hypothetical protein